MWDVPLPPKHPLRRVLAGLPSSPSSRASLLGLLAIICVFPFLFSSLHDHDPRHHHAIMAPHLRYETQATKGDPQGKANKPKPVKDLQPPTPATEVKDHVLPSATGTKHEPAPPPVHKAAAPAAVASPNTKAVAAPAEETEAAAAAPAAAKKAPVQRAADAAAPRAESKPSGFVVVEDPSKKAIVAKRRDDPILVYMDWTLPSDRFSLLNYRSLESVLTQYPNAHVRALVVAPSRSTHYKYANTLSYMQFEKYQKRGYDVQFELLSEHSLLDLKQADRPGFTYFTTVLFPRLKKTIFDESFFTKTENAVQDFKTNHFMRLFHLWRTGGVYMDFTMLLTEPLPPHKQFWSFAQDCSVAGVAGANASTYDDEKWRYSGSQHPYVLQFKAQDPTVGCVLGRFDDKGDELHECMLKSPKGGADCLEHALQQCAEKADGKRTDGLEVAPVDWRACGGASGQKVAPASSSSSAAAVVVSMGREAMEGNWKASPTVQALVDTHVHLDRWHSLQVDPSCARKCDYYTDAVARARAPFHQTKFSLTKAEAEASNYVCAPSVIVPGAIKAASSSLFNAISKHPQVLHPLRGSNFKETGMYMNIPGRDHFKDRLQAFPFIEPAENFVTTDGTVYYINGEESPEQIVADSPSAQAIISLRDPTSRAFSQYRYSFFNGTESFAEAVRVSVPVLRKCFQEHLGRVDLHAVLQEGKAGELAKEIDYCTAPLMRTPTRRAIQTSLYLPQLLRWTSVLGAERLLVVTKEDLGRDPKPVLADIFRFLGLCAYEEAFTAENVRKMAVPEGYDLTERSLTDLNEAFQPWNHALATFLKRDLGWPSFEQAFVDAKIHFHRVVVFQAATSSLAPCAACKKAHALLAAEQNVDPATDMEVVELRHDDPAWNEIRKAIGPKAKLQVEGMPHVFVQGEYVGTLKDVESKQKSGKLAAALAPGNRKGDAATFASYYSD